LGKPRKRVKKLVTYQLELEVVVVVVVVVVVGGDGGGGGNDEISDF
jgi:hypothetical protein